MITFETAQTIERSADDVWAYAADLARHPEWMGVTDARVVRGDGIDVGARALERITIGPRSYDLEIAVRESIPARRIGWTVLGGGPLAGDVTLDLEAQGPDRTAAVLRGTLGLTGLWRLVEPLLAAELRNGEAAELRRLKANLEAGAEARPAQPPHPEG